MSGNLGVHFRTVHGYERAYRIAGEGPALLLLHGIGDSSESWLPLMPALAERYTVIAPDLLGHGQSAKPRGDYSVGGYANGMRDLLEILGIERASVIGHSLGGGVAAQFAYQYPERCERLVLVGTGGVARAVTPLLRLASAPGAEVLFPIMQLPPSRILGRVALRMLQWVDTDLGVDAPELERVFDALPDAAARVAFTRTLRSVVDWRGQVVTLRDRCYLAESVPVFIVWGERDGVIPVHHTHAAHAAMPNSRLSVFEGAGHFPHHADPARFLAELFDFLETTEPLAYEPEHWRALLRGEVGYETPDEPDPEAQRDMPAPRFVA